MFYDAVDWLGASCGGYLSIRAGAFEPRIKHIISMPTSYSGLDMTLKQMRPGKAQELISLFKAGDCKATSWRAGHRNHGLACHQRLQARLDGGLHLAVERRGCNQPTGTQ
jgi:hypothetical protein